MDREFGVGRCKLLHLEWTNNKVLMYSTGNYIQSPEINHNGKEYLKKDCRTSLVVQWVRLCAPNAGDPGSIPGQRTRSHMHAATKSLRAATKDLTCSN